MILSKANISIWIFLLASKVIAAQVFHNFGNIQVHDQGQLGFHIDLINDGSFDQKNLGLVGFYNFLNPLTISGTNRPIFYDMEVDVINDLFLETAVGITNGTNLITGKIITPRNQLNNSLDFINDAIYAGESDERHVDGYTSISGLEAFIFPIGDDSRLRTMSIPGSITARTNRELFRGAYFFEDPNFPSSFSSAFDTDQLAEDVKIVSSSEFWDLNGSIETNVTLTWDAFSNINFLATDINNLIVVGWDKVQLEWKSLGNSNSTGDLTVGTITSNTFLPDDYEIITIGSNNTGGLTNFNYILSPDGDGINDVLEIEAAQTRPNNSLEVYNRWGVLVYFKEGYDNSWNGTSDARVTLSRDRGLPVGTYFYILRFKENNDAATGYIYINR